MIPRFTKHHTPIGEIIRVRSPLPFPLRWVNAYLVPEPSLAGGGFTLLDPGLRTAESIELWESVLAELGLTFADIRQIVLTHYHPDHYGLAGWFQEQTGAEVYLSRAGMELADALWGDGRVESGLTPLSQRLLSLFLDSGLPEALTASMERHMLSFGELVSPKPRVTELPLAGDFRLAGQPFRLLHTPGHAVGHVCLYHRDSSVLFCGDHVLPQITPNVSYIPGFEENPLHAYLSSLREIGELTTSHVFPGHRDPFSDAAGRAADIVEHHRLRLEQIRTILADAPNLTPYELNVQLFGDKLSMHQLRFALSETIAHLVYLRDQTE